MSLPAGELDDAARRARRTVVAALGVTQILAFGSTYYLPAVLARPIAADTGWPFPMVIGGLTAGLLAAGLLSPLTGRIINDYGGRPVLVASSLLLAGGLLSLALSRSAGFYIGSWLLLGLGMGTGLYDAAFGTLGRLYGREARRPIAALTLYGGFASTICWPLSAVFLEQFGWRGACLAYAALHLCVALPLHAFLIPRIGAAAPPAPSLPPAAEESPPQRSARPVLVVFLMACNFTLASGISGSIAVHLLTLLQANGLELAAAVALGALLGPSQVGARLVEIIIGRHYHPIWTLVASAVLVACGLLFLADARLLAISLILYGAGTGIRSIARGTVPLALFGSKGYALLLGRLAMPSLLAEALFPFAAAALLASAGAARVTQILVLLGAANVVVATLLWFCSRNLRSHE